MTTRWKRWISLDVGAAPGGFSLASTESLRVQFDIKRDEKPWPNTAELTVYNLNPDHRQYLGSLHGVPCKLHAGYEDGTGLLFDGMLREAKSTHNGTNWETHISAGDGELDLKGEPIAGKQIKMCWSRGTPLIAILQAFVTQLNISIGNAVAMGAAAKLPTGVALANAFSVDGPALDEFVYFMRSVGLPWSIQNGALQVRPAPAVPASMGPLIASSTGAIANVETSTQKVKRFAKITELKVCSGKVLLLPELLPGQMFALKSVDVTGPVLCTDVHHAGDTHGTEWSTSWEGNY
jgi:hypothetical protein